MSVFFKLEKKDVVGAQIAHSRRQLIALGCLLSALWLFSISFYYLYGPSEVWHFIYGVPLYVGVSVLFRMRSINRYIASDKSLREPIEVSWSVAGVVYATAKARAVYPWDQLFRWDETRGLLLIYVSTHGFIIIPKRAFSDPASLADLRRELIERRVKGPRGAKA